MTINPNWKMPLYMIGPALGLAVYGTILYSNLMGQLKESATVSQVQTWIDDARDANPNIKWPRLPSKQTGDRTLLNREAEAARLEQPVKIVRRELIQP